MNYTHCHYDTSDNNRVVRLTESGEEAATGLNKSALIVAVSVWPISPSPTAILRFSSGALVWFDPRTNANAWADVRVARNALLAGTDWRATKASDRADATWALSAWKVYRQALRDVPQTQSDPFNITWPTPPA